MKKVSDDLNKLVEDWPSEVRVTIRQVKFFWIWKVTYQGNSLFNRAGITLNDAKAFDKVIKVVSMISDFELRRKEEGYF